MASNKESCCQVWLHVLWRKGSERSVAHPPPCPATDTTWRPSRRTAEEEEGVWQSSDKHRDGPRTNKRDCDIRLFHITMINLTAFRIKLIMTAWLYILQYQYSNYLLLTHCEKKVILTSSLTSQTQTIDAGSSAEGNSPLASKQVHCYTVCQKSTAKVQFFYNHVLSAVFWTEMLQKGRVLQARRISLWFP